MKNKLNFVGAIGFRKMKIDLKRRAFYIILISTDKDFD